MDFLLQTLFWFLLFYYVLGRILRGYIDKKDREIIREKLDEKIRVVRLETLSEYNTILAFDAEDNRFLGQGISEQEIETAIKARFPNNIFILDKRIFSAIPDIQNNHETSNAS